MCAAAKPVLGLDQQNVAACIVERARGGDPGRAATDNDGVSAGHAME